MITTPATSTIIHNRDCSQDSKPQDAEIVMDDFTLLSRPKIPYDLLSPIFEHLKRDNLSLCAISLSSSILRHEAQRILFRDVATAGSDSAHLKFLRSVAASPMRLALLVRVYALSFVRDDEYGLSAEMLDVLHDALESMCKLERLELFFGVFHKVHGGPWKIAWMLRGCTFNLQYFNWYYPSDAEADEIITEFLPRQHGLKHLGIFPPGKLQNTRPPLFDTICPQLVSLKGEWNTIKALLPGHEITALTFQSGDPLRRIANVPELQHIKAFSCMLYSETAVRILEQCSSVSVLELSKFQEEDYQSASTVRMLPRLSLLRTLILSRKRSTVEPLGKFQQLALKIYEKSSLNLECIDITIDKTRGIYARFKRSPESVPEEVSEREVRKWWLSE